MTGYENHHSSVVEGRPSSPGSFRSPPSRPLSPLTDMQQYGGGNTGTPKERELMVQVMQSGSKIRVSAATRQTKCIVNCVNQQHRPTPNVHQELDGELDERARLLTRTKLSIESLQNDLARAHKSEETVRAQTREAVDAQTRRVAELERQLLHARGDSDSREEEARALRAQNSALEDELGNMRGTVKRMEVELAAAERHRAKAAEAERTVAFQQAALRESAEAAKVGAAQFEALETEQREQGTVVRQLIATAGVLKQRRDWLEVEARELRLALEEAARRHESAMAAADAAVTQLRTAAAGKFSGELQLRLSKLQGRVTALADKEERMLQRQTAMAEDLAAVRVTAETEYSRRVEIERALHQSANIFKQQIWTKDEELAQMAEAVRVLRDKLNRSGGGVARASHRVALVGTGAGGGAGGDEADGSFSRRGGGDEGAGCGCTNTNMNMRGFGPAVSSSGMEDLGGAVGEVELSKLRHSRDEYQREMLEQDRMKLDLLGKIASEMGLEPFGDEGDGVRDEARDEGGNERGAWGRIPTRGDVSTTATTWSKEAVHELSHAIGALDHTLGVRGDNKAVDGEKKSWKSTRP